MLKFIKSLFKSIPSYTIEYIAIGFMSNKFSAGTYTFVPTTEELLEFGTDYRNISAIGFRRNYNDIIKYFNIENADIKYKYKLIAIDGVPLKGKNK